MFIMMVTSLLNSCLGREWEGGRDQRQNAQLRNSELEGKIENSKNKCGPAAPLPGEEQWCLLSLPPWRGWKGRGRGSQRATTTGCGGTISPKGGRTQGHTTGGTARTPLTQNHTTRGKGAAGETAPLPLPSSSSPRGGCGPWALDRAWAGDSWLGLARSWTGHGLAPLHGTCVEPLQLTHTDSDVPVEVDSLTRQDNTHQKWIQHELEIWP